MAVEPELGPRDIVTLSNWGKKSMPAIQGEEHFKRFYKPLTSRKGRPGSCLHFTKIKKEENRGGKTVRGFELGERGSRREVMKKCRLDKEPYPGW